MLFEISIIVGGSIAYMILGEKSKSKPSKDKKENKSSKEDNTFQYFNNLTLEDQEEYFNSNYDLNYYKDEMLTDNRYFNAKHAAEISRRTGKEFTNKNKRY